MEYHIYCSLYHLKNTKKNNLKKFSNFPDSLLLTKTCNSALTKCNLYLYIPDFLCHPECMKEIFCKIFGLFLFLSIEQIYARIESIKIELFQDSACKLESYISCVIFKMQGKESVKVLGFCFFSTGKGACISINRKIRFHIFLA